MADQDGRLRSEVFAKKFGENLRSCRNDAGMSQEELGDRSGLHRTEVGLLEQGTRLARTDTMMKIAGALEVSPMLLIDGIEWVPGHSVEGSFVVVDPVKL